MNKLSLLFLLISSSCFGQLPNSTIQTSCDSVIDGVVTQLSGKQTTYLGSKGGYCQLLPTHTVIPADGTTETPILTAKPTDQNDSWSTQSVTLSSKIPCALSVNYYNGPSGKGYEVVGLVVISGRTYMRRVNVGPETHRTHNWK
jgi:hypothetical protein